MAAATSPGSMPGGSLAGIAASRATSGKVRVWLVAGAENTPSVNVTAAGSAFSAKAAIARALAITLSAAAATAEPPSVAVREPPVPSPKAT